MWDDDLDFDDDFFESDYYYDSEAQLELLKSFCDGNRVFWNDDNGQPEFFPEVILEIPSVFNAQEVSAIFGTVLQERGFTTDFVSLDAIPNIRPNTHEIRLVFDLRDVSDKEITNCMTVAKRLHTAFLMEV